MASRTEVPNPSSLELITNTSASATRRTWFGDMSQKVHTVPQPELVAQLLQALPEGPLSRDGPMQLRERLSQQGGRAKQSRVILVGDQRADVYRQRRPLGQAEPVPKPHGGCCRRFREIHSRVHHHDATRIDPVGLEHARDSV